jgi:hypothetical protein
MNGLQHTGAFVVQFQAGTDFERHRVAGRMEHVASGLTAHFESANELLQLFARFLTAAAVEPTRHQERRRDEID